MHVTFSWDKWTRNWKGFKAKKAIKRLAMRFRICAWVCCSIVDIARNDIFMLEDSHLSSNQRVIVVLWNHFIWSDYHNKLLICVTIVHRWICVSDQLIAINAFVSNVCLERLCSIIRTIHIWSKIDYFNRRLFWNWICKSIFFPTKNTLQNCVNINDFLTTCRTCCRHTTIIMFYIYKMSTIWTLRTHKNCMSTFVQ